MTIWVDADSCPKQVREIVVRASRRCHVEAFFVANTPLTLPPGKLISMVITSKEEGSADDYIVDHVGPKDLVITRDIPLADRLVSKNILVINDRGTQYSSLNIKERLSQRDFMKMMREAGIGSERTKNFGQKELKAFASCFDRVLTQALLEK